MTNIFEKAAAQMGRIKGTYDRALKSVNAPIGDPTAWMGGTVWGEGAALAMSKPGRKQDIAKWFTSWCFICTVSNANARSAVPTGLFVAAESKGKAWRTISTSPRSITRQRRKHIENRADLRRFVTKSEDIEEVTEHRYLDLVKRPNPYMSETDLKWLTSAFMDLCGEAYWYVGVKDNVGVPVQAWIIPSMYMNPVAGKSLDDYVIGYEYQRGTVKQTLPPEDIIHFRNPNPLNDYTGFSPLRGVADSLYVNFKMAEFESAMFENKARPGGIFTSETGMSVPALDRAAEQIQQKYAGARQAGKSMMLPPGIKFLPDSMTPNELSFLEGKKVTAVEICAGFGCPYALFDPNAIRANVEGAQYSHAKYGVQPWLTRYDDTLNGDLMLMYDPEGKLFVASDNPVPEDKAYLLQKRTVDIASGVSVINEERADDGKEPIEGGDEPLVSSALIPLSRAVREPEPAPAPIIVPAPAQGGKPKPGEEGDEGNIDTGTGEGGKAVDRLAGMVLAKVKERLNGHA